MFSFSSHIFLYVSKLLPLYTWFFVPTSGIRVLDSRVWFWGVFGGWKGAKFFDRETYTIKRYKGCYTYIKKLNHKSWFWSTSSLIGIRKKTLIGQRSKKKDSVMIIDVMQWSKQKRSCQIVDCQFVTIKFDQIWSQGSQEIQEGKKKNICQDK